MPKWVWTAGSTWTFSQEEREEKNYRPDLTVHFPEDPFAIGPGSPEGGDYDDQPPTAEGADAVENDKFTTEYDVDNNTVGRF